MLAAQVEEVGEGERLRDSLTRRKVTLSVL